MKYIAFIYQLKYPSSIHQWCTPIKQPGECASSSGSVKTQAIHTPGLHLCGQASFCRDKCSSGCSGLGAWLRRRKGGRSAGSPHLAPRSRHQSDQLLWDDLSPRSPGGSTLTAWSWSIFYQRARTGKREPDTVMGWAKIVLTWEGTTKVYKTN